MFIFRINCLNLYHNCKTWCKNRNSLYLGLKFLICVSLGCYFKKLSSYLKLALLNVSKNKVSCKIKTLKLCDQNCLIWVFLGCNFKTVIKLVSFIQNKKSLNLGPNIPYQARNTKSKFIFEIGTRIYLYPKFHAKPKSYKFGTRSVTSNLSSINF